MVTPQNRALIYIEKLRRVHGLKRQDKDNSMAAKVSRTNRAINADLAL
jgi:hypothetical protein